MAYTSKNYRSKKEVKADIARLLELREVLGKASELLSTETLEESKVELSRLENRLSVYQPNGDITGFDCPANGFVTLEGPHYPEPHRWYGQGEVKDRILIKIK